MQKNKFKVDDRVKLLVEGVEKGPYVISTVPGPGRYTLSLSDGTPINNSSEVNESDLIPA
jgi:hypothetical protein